MWELVANIVLMYAVVGAAALWYRSKTGRLPLSRAHESTQKGEA